MSVSCPEVFLFASVSLMDSKSFFLSTSIPYVNARPHIGYALELVQADVIARYQRLLGSDVFFLAGTDDNALKNVQAAEAAGKGVQEYINQNAAVFKELTEKLNTSISDFIRTSAEERHRLGAQKLWSNCKPEDLYKKSYKGLYCVGCEEFKTEKDLVHGECQLHPGKKLEVVEEENYFFKLSNYQAQLLELIESNTLRITPESRRNEMLAFIKGGLEDFSISRSVARAKGWGIPVPGDETQVMYVWFDALSNYINGLGYAKDSEEYQKYWVQGSTRLHCIGKDINRFHTIYWPAMLLSAGVNIPTDVFVHGFITVDGQKMSKSIGNVVDPFDLIDEWGSEVTRYFLFRLPTFDDGDFARSRLTEIYNGDLANGLGNLVSRVLKMAISYEVEADLDLGSNPLPKAYTDELDQFRIDRGAEYVWQVIKELDGYVQKNEPFKTIKTNPEKAKADVAYLLKELYRLSVLLTPFLPETAQKISVLLKERKMGEPLFLRKG